MTTDHPMQPPSWLVEQIAKQARDLYLDDEGDPVAVDDARDEYIARAAYAAGADAELEACLGVCRDRNVLSPIVQWIRDARRPKPLSLKEQALIDLEELGGHYVGPGAAQRFQNIRNALEALNDDN